MSDPNHPKVENLDRVVLLLSNQQGEDRLFIEVTDGITEPGTPAAVSIKKRSTGWFDQAWLAEQSAQSVDKATSLYRLRNLRSGTYLQAGNKLTDGSTEIIMAPASDLASVKKKQTWHIGNDGGFARIKNLATGQVFELSEPGDGTPATVSLRDNHLSDKETQTWRYERVSRSAEDVKAALKKNDHMRQPITEYQSTDACYIILPPNVRNAIWESSMKGLVWRRELFDCDDFAFAAKTAVASWANKTLKADGFTILFGITFAERKTEKGMIRHAYNWYLDWDELNRIVFFEPSDGSESFDGWKYQGFNGIF